MEMNIPGKFSSLEAAILGYLYDHPEGVISTTGLTGILKSEESAIQYGIESLIAARLVAGDRFSKSGKVQYAKLRLTTKGQSEAIKEKRRTKSIILNVLTLGPEAPTTHDK